MSTLHPPGQKYRCENNKERRRVWERERGRETLKERESGLTWCWLPSGRGSACRPPRGDTRSAAGGSPSRTSSGCSPACPSPPAGSGQGAQGSEVRGQGSGGSGGQGDAHAGDTLSGGWGLNWLCIILRFSRYLDAYLRFLRQDKATLFMTHFSYTRQTQGASHKNIGLK